MAKTKADAAIEVSETEETPAAAEVTPAARREASTQTESVVVATEEAVTETPVVAAAEAPATEAPAVVAETAQPVTLTQQQQEQLRGQLAEANRGAGIIPELIQGDTLDAMLASVEVAKAAFGRAREELDRAATAVVRRGGGTRSVDPATFEGLSGEGKIAAALAVGARG